MHMTRAPVKGLGKGVRNVNVCVRTLTRVSSAYTSPLQAGKGAQMLRKLALFVFLLLLPSLTVPALAQVQSGSIFVKIVDEQGAALPGVTVTVTSPVLPRPLTGVTD